MEATQATGDLRRQALDYVVGQDLDGFDKAQEALQGAAVQEDDKALVDLCHDLLRGAYEDVHKHPSIAKLLDLDDASGDKVKENIAAFIESAAGEDEKERRRELVLLSGVYALLVFVQANWTGPDLHEDIRKLVPAQEYKEIALDSLLLDGETMYPLTRYLNFLQHARWVLRDSFNHISSVKSAAWWSARLMMAWQQLLSGPTATLKDALALRYQESAASYADSPLEARLCLETGLYNHYFNESEQAKIDFKKAQEKTGLYVNLTGALGRRTKFQQFDTAQLILEAVSKGTGQSSSSSHPQEVENQNDVLLPEPTYTGPVQHQDENLDVLDQCILLSLCLDVKNNNPRHGLTTEEMFPYVRRVQKNPNNWMVHSTCLLTKSRLESESNKTADRAVLQMQALVEQFYDEEKDLKKERHDVIRERSHYLFALAFPCRLTLQKELGERFLSMGMAASALQIFEQFEMWESVITCYRVMGKDKKAEQVVLERLDVNPTPELWCLLGDLTEVPQHYLTAWDLSKRRYARAMRSLGNYCLRQEKWKECAEYYELALAINPLYMNTWFSLGCSYMRFDEWDKALRAFSRVVSLDPEQPEAWANMASIYIKQKKKLEAFRCLSEGLKHSYDNWKMWQNYLYVAVDLGEFQASLQAITRLVDLVGPSVDIEVLGLLVDRLLFDHRRLQEVPADSDEIKTTGPYVEQARKKLEELLAHITSKVTNQHEIWAIYAKYHEGFGNKEKALDARLKQMRSASPVDWQNDEKKFKTVAEVSLLLVDTYLMQDEEDLKKSLFSAKLHLRGVLKKAEANWKGTEQYAKLEEKLAVVLEKEQALKA